jgi:BirA family biotin operon repressor/biotin-[acetyl-CoA-carboxylase] ligase
LTELVVERVGRCDSTQAVALARAEAGAAHGLVVVADAQTAGRGRRGRAWLPAEGALAFTVLLRPRVDVERLTRLSFVAAAALSDAARALGAEPLFKWPNDLVIAHDVPGPLGPLRKVAGILVELDTDASGAVTSARLGVGVNVGRAPAELPDLAGHLDVDGDALLEAFLARLPAALAALEDEHAWRGTLDALRARSATLGREIEIEGVRGRATAMDDDGALLVDAPGGSRRFLTGDVELLPSR